ncbi:hypothetical protein [Streptomyces sp. NPDC058872]|uniref:hypothetical protein n=2 Tax=Streptomyces TaxID=1883 RepID=UPI0036990E7A
MAWGVYMTALGWIVVTDVRGAAHRFHDFSRAFRPSGSASARLVSVGFLRVMAGVFALIGPVVLVHGLVGLWHGEAGVPMLPRLPPLFVAAQVAVFGIFFWRVWRRSGVLRREWDGGSGPQRAVAVGLTASMIVLVATLGFGWWAWAMVSGFVTGLCGIALLLCGRPVGPSTG